ncbi:glucosamine-6-phosphate deaminase [Pseudopedobacter beijingensis]|uniref:Glucosamine-6-phosphate deaminase n=1 Tax=Pseudopedobacter beijingensis TaxID=1207056 RepID=A0ABW4IGY0_9SPHI
MKIQDNYDEQFIIYSDKYEASRVVADEMCNVIEEIGLAGGLPVLGLATGATPEIIYKYLIEAYQKGKSFAKTICFNLDEYYPIQKENPNSFYYSMYKQLFNYIDIPDNNIHIPHIGTLDTPLHDFCKDYENKINQVGGIDLQILGIGENGHIAFNEPGSDFNSLTRLVDLDEVTRKNAAADFGGVSAVPNQGITMGIQSILQAKKIILLAFGENKGRIMNRLLYEPITPDLPASFLKLHSNCQFVLDEACAKNIKYMDIT